MAPLALTREPLAEDLETLTNFAPAQALDLQKVALQDRGLVSGSVRCCAACLTTLGSTTRVR